MKFHLAFITLMSLFSFTAAASEPQRPNIVVFLSDDAGFEEFGIYKVKKDKASNTPNIDRLGERGTTFAHCWGQSICGPSRSMFLSGNYAVHNGAYDNNLKYLPEVKGKIQNNPERVPSFTKLIKDAGYQVAIAGKWHNPAGYMVLKNPKELGVDEYCMWNAYPRTFEKLLGVKLIPDDTWEPNDYVKKGSMKISRYWKPGIIQNNKVLTTTMKDYGPDIYSDFVCDFIKKNAAAKKPFLAYYTMVLPHDSHCVTPIEVAQGATPSNKNYPKHTEKGYQMFLSQLHYADKLVGKVVRQIEASGIADNTIIIYASDNGTTSSAKGKGVKYGVHVPFIVAGAGIKKRGMTQELMDFTDVLPTLVDFAGASLPQDKNVDGKSLKPFLTGESEHTKEVIYSFPGVGRLVRTKDYMLECVSPLYTSPVGRFYKTNGSWDGRAYENISTHPEYASVRKLFVQHMSKIDWPLPTSFEDPVWQHPSMQQGFKHFTNKKVKKRFFELPKSYPFYDPSFKSKNH